MSAKIETPEEMANRISETTTGRYYAKHAVEFRDEQIAACCEEKAKEAAREASAQIDVNYERMLYCEGQAQSFRALAAILRGSST